jgi:hypothetical protein
VELFKLEREVSPRASAFNELLHHTPFICSMLKLLCDPSLRNTGVCLMRLHDTAVCIGEGCSAVV